MPVKFQRNVVVRSKFLTRKNDLTNEISTVISPNRFQVGLSGSLSSPFASDLIAYGPGKFHGGISGSLTQLVDGTSYIIAGSNMTITSASNGSVTLAAAGGSTSPGGSNTQVQYNNGGSFGGAADLTYALSTGDVTIGASTGDAKLFFRDSGNYIYSNADGDFDIINVDGSAADSIKIDAQAGGIDIDAAGAINIEAASDAAHSYITATRKQLVLSGAKGMQVKSDSGTIKIDANKGAVDIDCGTTFKVDADSDFSIDGVGTSNVTTNGALTVSGSTGLNLHSDSGEIDVTTTAVGADIDINAAGRVLIAATEDSIASIDLDAAGSIFFHGGDHNDNYLFYHKPMWFDTITEPTNTTINKLYNVGGQLRWGGTGFLCTSSAHFNASGGALGDFQVESVGEDEAIFLDASANTLYINRGATSFITLVKNTNDEVLAVKSAGLIVNENGNASVDTRIETDNKTHAFFVDAGTDQVLILSGGAGASTNEAIASDVAFYVSGSKGSAVNASAERGASLFGGDVVISGSLYLKDTDPDANADPQLILHRISPSAAPDDILGSVIFSGQDDGGNIQVYSSITGEINDETGGTEDGVITFKIAKSATLYSALELKDNETVFNNNGRNIDFRVESDAKQGAIMLDAANDQMALLANGSAPSFGDDTALLVSGSIGSRGTSDAGTAVFRGDVYASGSLHISGSSIVAADVPKLSVGCSPTTPPKTALDVTFDYKTHDFTDLLAAGEGGGDRLRLGEFAAGVSTAGRIFYYSAGTWRPADADNVNTMQLLGVALDVDGGADEGLVLLKGFVRVPASSVVNGAGSSADLGDPVYVSTTSSKWDFTAPSAGGDYKRFVGYCLDYDSSTGDYLMWFNPDNYTQAL